MTRLCRVAGRRGSRPGGPPAARALAAPPRRTAHSTRVRGVLLWACCQRVPDVPAPCGEPVVAGEAVDCAAPVRSEWAGSQLEPGETRSRGPLAWQQRTPRRMPHAV